MRVRKTKTGYRLLEHGVVLSEMRATPGPTHSVFDVLATAIHEAAPVGRVGLLGFAAGSLVAPFRRLGDSRALETCDLDGDGFVLFEQHCGDWAGVVDWSMADAEQWLKHRPGTFDVLIDDLSVPVDGDVFKPEASWSRLPAQMRSRLKRNGVLIANQLKPMDASWRSGMAVFEALFEKIHVVHFEDFENRIVIAGNALPNVRTMSHRVRTTLRELGSRQAERVKLRTWRADWEQE